MLCAVRIGLAYLQMQQKAQQVHIVQRAIPQYAATVVLQTPRMALHGQIARVADAPTQQLADAVGQQQLMDCVHGRGRAPGVIQRQHQATVLCHLHQWFRLRQAQCQRRFTEHMLMRLQGRRHRLGMVAWVTCDIHAVDFRPLQQFVQGIGEMDDGVPLGKVARAPFVVAVQRRHPGARHITRARQRRLFTNGRQHLLRRNVAGARHQKAHRTGIGAARKQPRRLSQVAIPYSSVSPAPAINR